MSAETPRANSTAPRSPEPPGQNTAPSGVERPHGPDTAPSGAEGAHGPDTAPSGAERPHWLDAAERGVDRAVWAEGVGRFKAGRMWVARHRPYYARALFACPVSFTADVDTVAVNGYWRMKANPAFCAAHTAEQVGAVLIHEVNHLLRDHHYRSLRAGVPDEGMALWGYATDLEINDDLRSELAGLPDWVLLPENHGMEPGRLAEQYYHDLIDMHRSDRPDRACDHDHASGPHNPDGPGGEGGDEGGGEGGLSRARQEQVRRQTAQDIVDHVDNHGEGAAPGGLQQWAFRKVDPRVDWRRLLAAELRKGLHRRPGTGDNTWSRPPRRPDDESPVLRPGQAQPTADIAVIVDTSSSMGDDDHACAIAETQHILDRAVPGEAIRVYSADYEIIAGQTVTQTRQIHLTGGCGTDMGRAVITAAQARPRPAIIIVITDGYTPWPDHRPPAVTAKVIAVLTRPCTAGSVPRWITAIEAFATIA